MIFQLGSWTNKTTAFTVRQVGFRTPLAHESRALSAPRGRARALERRWWPSAVPSPSPLLPVAQHLHSYDLRAQVRSGNELRAEASVAQRGPASEPVQPLQEEVLQPAPRSQVLHLQLTVPLGRSKRSPLLHPVSLSYPKAAARVPPTQAPPRPTTWGETAGDPCWGHFPLQCCH